MKKVLFILLLCFITAYTVNAQTKEETITWLQDKLQKYIYYDNYGDKATDVSVKITECFITITYTLSTYENNKWNSYYGQYYIIPTTKVELGSMGIRSSGGIAGIKVKFRDHNVVLSQYTNFDITKGEENLYERLQKAVDHLATFCPKKEETF